MAVESVDVWSRFGLVGMVIGALFAVIVFLVNQHRQEVKEWIAAYKEQAKQSDMRQAETNAVIRELTVVVRESMANLRGR